MISLLITLLVLCVVVVILCYVVDLICGSTGVPAPIPMILKLVIGLIALLVVLRDIAPALHLSF